MKKQMRQSVFETNSSSTHSLTMCSAKDYERWVKGELMFDRYSGGFINVNSEITEDEKVEAMNYYEKKKDKYWKEWHQLSKEELDEWYDKYMYECKKIDGYRYNTYDEFFDGYMDEFEERYTATNGEVIVAFGKYGYDG